MTRKTSAMTVGSTVAALIFTAGSARAEDLPAGNAQVPPTAPTELSEIVVTAQRRTQSIQDVPYNISAISPGALTDSAVSNANDLSHVIAGLGTVDEGPGNRSNQNNLTLRGLRTDNPGSNDRATLNTNSVSTYYGDTPLFFSILTEDLERVEV